MILKIYPIHKNGDDPELLLLYHLSLTKIVVAVGIIFNGQEILDIQRKGTGFALLFTAP